MKEIPPKLRWQCRRGMLELDVLLGNFLENEYLRLGSAEQDIFVTLLSRNDQELFEWLTAKATPNDPDLLFMVEKIREHARTKR